MSKLSLKANPAATPFVAKDRRKKTVIIEKKPNADTVRRFKRPTGTPDYVEVFGSFKPHMRSTGEDIMILRAYMHLEGLPEIPENRGLLTFATVFSRFVLARCVWPFFPDSASGRASARKFLKTQADLQLPRVIAGGKPKPQPYLHSQMIPELSAFYAPEYFGLGAA